MDVEEANQPKKAATRELLKKLELGLLPYDDIKQLIRIELAKRLQWGYKSTCEEQVAEVLKLVLSLQHMKIANEVETLDSQLYEPPMSFLKIIFGSTIKGRCVHHFSIIENVDSDPLRFLLLLLFSSVYELISTELYTISSSCCYFQDDSITLDDAEIAMLDLYCERAQIKDGNSVMDLGCGQGAITLFVAQKYKQCQVKAITNSISQKEYIDEQCRTRNLVNVEVILADITTYEMDDTSDRILAIGLFEHMKNYKLLLKKISKWMAEDGLLFVDHVCHKTLAYQYKALDEDDWFTEYIFPAETIIFPSASFLLYFQNDVSVVNHWILNGNHFSQTHGEWLKRLDANVAAIKQMFKSLTGNDEEALKMINFWRIFCLFGIELFGYNNGEEWMTSHVLFKKK
ncbi:hypothetical protein IFM89_033027 [Coptis chinensis]|uniref:(S)-coclaurine-N-methyltransferase n=1 Tax=Coptis chinensis TaxID=261450 RepID=A0A835M5B0_9MAGN|nr:hypothetical protein IFM89_033027 [Coptis chinensis]